MITALEIGLICAAAVPIVFALLRMLRGLRKFRIKKPYTAALEAPSVTVCIPARNEIHAMTQCLERVLASDYKKLEVIVYDDSSKDDTSIVIKSFAHAGIRFVPGGDLPEGWLGRNHALETLAREASGTYVLFMDVDTYIKPSSISQLVGYMITEELVMTSVLPGRADVWRVSVLFGHLRYFWEIIFDRAVAPAVSSSLWMINRHVLLDTLGGFTAHKNEVQPESHIAAIIGTKAYHSLITTSGLGVFYEKKWRSQAETSRRLLFPMTGGHWYGAVLGSTFLILLNVPFILMLTVFFSGWTPSSIIGSCLMIIQMMTYAIYLRHVWRTGWIIGAVLWPYVILQELVFMLTSIWGYTRHTITWKGRSVTASPIRTDRYEISK